MKIYTKKGDFGETSLLNGDRISKSSVYIDAIGNLDEVTSYIGWAREQITNDDERVFLSSIQHDVYILMGVLAGAPSQDVQIKERIREIESRIDIMTEKLPRLTQFVLPQGSEAATRMHIVRTVVRRAERAVVAVQDSTKHKLSDCTIIITYINRLSDYFFTLGRLYTQKEHRV